MSLRRFGSQCSRLNCNDIQLSGSQYAQSWQGLVDKSLLSVQLYADIKTMASCCSNYNEVSSGRRKYFTSLATRWCQRPPLLICINSGVLEPHQHVWNTGSCQGAGGDQHTRASFMVLYEPGVCVCVCHFQIIQNIQIIIIMYIQYAKLFPLYSILCSCAVSLCICLVTKHLKYL